MSVEALAEEWELTLGELYVPGGASEQVVRAELADGTPAVLKIGIPHRESEQEADALARWDGDGAVRLLRRDDARNALLLERCEPGTFLSEGADDPLGVLIELLPRLWKDAAGFRTLAEETVWWLEDGDLSRAAPGRLRSAAVALAASSRRHRASSCSSTRTCTAKTCSPRSASRGSSSIRSRSPRNENSRWRRSSAHASWDTPSATSSTGSTACAPSSASTANGRAGGRSSRRWPGWKVRAHRGVRRSSS